MTVSYESFVYLWFDSKNRKFYLGSHKGHEDDWYTHSSHVMESFSKRTIPSHMRRRILARGSYEEMIQLEIDLIDNRRKRCWDKYHNLMVSFPPPPRYGKDNPNYIHGKSRSGAHEYREWRLETNPNFLEQEREASRRYRANNLEKERERHRRYHANNLEKIAESRRKYRANNPEKVREANRKYRAKKKAEQI